MKTSFRLFGAALTLCVATSTPAQPIQVNNAGMEISQTRYVLNADFHLDLNGPLLEALNNGVSLGFLVEFELTRPRWYWFDEKAAFEKLELRLSYLPKLDHVYDSRADRVRDCTCCDQWRNY